MDSLLKFKKMCVLIGSSPRLGLLATLLSILPNPAKSFLLYRAPGHCIGRIRIGNIEFKTDAFHAFQVIDTFWFDGLEKFSCYRLEKGMTIIDVGAHHGMYSVKAALNGANRVVAIEPNPFNFMMLLQNLSVANTRNVLPLNVAISSGTNKVILFEAMSSGGHTICKEMRNTYSEGYTGRELTVEACSLDALVINLGITPDIIKIDTQGAELEITQGATQTLQIPGVRFVIDTHSKHIGTGVERLLVAAGFKIDREKETIYARHLPEMGARTDRSAC